MSSVVTEFPDQTYTTSNKPSVETLKADISALETGHNDLETTAMKLAGTQTVTGQKTFGSGLLVTTAPVIRAWDGWNAVADTWTYASATTITVPTGAASLYQIGDKIKLTQTTVKYFFVTAVADTLLTITGGSDYTLANAAITLPYVSHEENPVGFPGYFNFAPARAVSGGTVPTYTALDISHFTIKGLTLFGNCSWCNSSGGTAGAGGAAFTFTLPVACKSGDFVADRNHLGMGMLFESGGTICGVNVVGATSSTNAEFSNVTSAAAIVGNDQSSTVRYVNFSLQYRIA